jgi:DNA repair exonuclease SbcCD nuclease subunit
MGRKILHIADLHLGYLPPLGEAAERYHHERDQLLKRITTWVLSEGREEVGAVLIVGDLFETHRPPEALTASVVHSLSRLVEAGVRVVTIPGNHDELTYPDSVYRRWGPQWPGILVTNPRPQEVAVLELDDLRVAICALAYIQNASDEFPQFPKIETDCNCCIAAAHATLVDEMADFITEGERVLKLRLRDLAELGYDYLALGHIHAANHEWVEGNTLAAYAGLIEGKTFGDPGGAGLLLVDPSTQPPSIERRPFARHRLITKDIHLQDVMDEADLEKQILSAVHGGEESRAALRLRFHGQPGFSLDLERLRGRMADRFMALELSLEDPAWDLGDWTRWKDEATLRGSFVRRILARLDSAQSQDERQRLHEAAALGLHALREATEEARA